MALKSTINKAVLNIADMNRNYYHSHSLTLAQHPSETDERLMMRLVAFALHANEDLVFTKGISTDEEPDIWQKDLTDQIVLWIDLGQIEEKRIKKACGKSAQVIIYTYQSRSAKPWWQKLESGLKRFHNLSVIEITPVSTDSKPAIPIESLLQRNMQLQCNIQDNLVYLSSTLGELEMSLHKLM